MLGVGVAAAAGGGDGVGVAGGWPGTQKVGVGMVAAVTRQVARMSTVGPAGVRKNGVGDGVSVGVG